MSETMARMVITEKDIDAVLAQGKKRIEIPRETIVTPLAAERAGSKGVEIVTLLPEAPMNPPTKPSPHQSSTPSHAPTGQVIAFGSDHGGYQLKEQLKSYAESLGYKVLDVGTYDEKPCDYPDYAYAVARAVSAGEAWRGVMIDGAGIGSCVVANKVPGIKAACCHNEFVARNAREHNDTNVLTLGSRVTGTELCKEILKTWLETWFAGGRHKQRVEKIAQIEEKFMK
jgi:ribose 5-phosphate isomerase B